MNIVVDGRAFTKVSAGISTFLKCSLLEWAKQQPNNSFWVLLPHEQDITLEFEDRPLNLHFYTSLPCVYLVPTPLVVCIIDRPKIIFHYQQDVSL